MLTIISVAVAVLGVAGYFWANSQSESAFDELLDVTDDILSVAVYGERNAYFGGACPRVFDNFDDVSEERQAVVISRAYIDINSKLRQRLLVGVSEIENVSIPFWAEPVEAARAAILAHLGASLDLLERESQLAIEMSNVGSHQERLALWRDIAAASELASPTISSTRETAERRLEEAAPSDEDSSKVDWLFLVDGAMSPTDCDDFEPATERW